MSKTLKRSTAALDDDYRSLAKILKANFPVLVNCLISSKQIIVDLKLKSIFPG